MLEAHVNGKFCEIYLSQSCLKYLSSSVYSAKTCTKLPLRRQTVHPTDKCMFKAIKTLDYCAD